MSVKKFSNLLLPAEVGAHYASNWAVKSLVLVLAAKHQICPILRYDLLGLRVLLI